MSARPEIQVFVHTSVFPPASRLPPCSAEDLDWLVARAQGAPGATVWPGLFPRTPAKLARLLLAASGAFDAQTVLTSARTAYLPDSGCYLPGRPRAARRYDAHDALACALVHPLLAVEVRQQLLGVVLAAADPRRGARSRRKSWEVVRWAVRAGYLPAEGLPAPVRERLTPAPSRPHELRSGPAAPLGIPEALERLAASWPRFRRIWRRERQADSWSDYPGIAALGREHFAAFANGCHAPWIAAVFTAIEQILCDGDHDAQNLIVVGLFEAVQGVAYRAGIVGNAYEAALLPRSRKAWADLIEGWTGAGIRDLNAWRQLAPSRDKE